MREIKVIEAGLYTKDGEKVIDFTDICIPPLLGERVFCKEEKNEEKDDEQHHARKYYLFE